MLQHWDVDEHRHYNIRKPDDHAHHNRKNLGLGRTADASPDTVTNTKPDPVAYPTPDPVTNTVAKNRISPSTTTPTTTLTTTQTMHYWPLGPTPRPPTLS